jgi:hypothetical protein
VLTRPRWLIKWLLIIPHAVVLYFLWIAVLVVTIVAGFAILFTGRYPRPLFGFTAGVIRWTWRVAFYAIGAFGTDRYPPFTLDHDPTYPAGFDVEYPERLSRGLVLVKWWLLAIPHYLVVGIFAGAGPWGGWDWGGTAHDGWGGWGYGLIGLLALIAAVTLAVTGRYPGQLFDFIMGLNRWCFRVVVYAVLMRDEYPPFRIDPGGTDPGHAALPSAGPAAPGAP